MPPPFSRIRGVLAFVVVLTGAALIASDEPRRDPVAEAAAALANMNVRPGDSPQFGVSSLRNNVSGAQNLPIQWDVTAGFNIKWSAKLSSQTCSTPVVANGKVFIGTGRADAYVRRAAENADLGVLLCFDEATGKFLWQQSNLNPAPVGQKCGSTGVWSTPYVEGHRLWYVNNLYEVVCLDTEGFRDGKNDGPLTDEPNQEMDDADIIWKFSLVDALGVTPRPDPNRGRAAEKSRFDKICSSITAYRDTLFVCTCNGVGVGGRVITPEAPGFAALNKNTGAVVWTDRSPSANILDGQWSSPAFGKLGGVEQAIFGGADGWVYSFDFSGDPARATLLWKFDCNPKTSQFRLERSTRNSIMAAPVIYDGFVYVGVGQVPDRGEGPGHLWCIDPTKRGDVSPTQVFNERDPATPVPPRRLIACDKAAGDFERENDNSASVWHYTGNDPKLFEQTMHRTVVSSAIKEDLLFIADASGLVHCLDAKTGAACWTHDVLALCWSTPLIAGQHVYVADYDGKVSVFLLAREKQLIAQHDFGDSIRCTPVAANGVLYIATDKALYAIAP